MHLVNKNYCKSGQNGDDFNGYSKRDLTLNYMHFMIKDSDMLLTLVNKELEGGAGAESGSFAGPAGAVGGGNSGNVEQTPVPSTATRSNTAAKRTSRANANTFASMARSSAAMADSSARRTAALMVRALTRALTENRAAGSPAAVIEALETQLVEAIKDCSSKRKRTEGSEAGSEREGDSGVDEQG